MSDRTLTAAEHPHGLSPMVEAVRLENAIRRKRRQVEKLATKLEEVEFERQVFERELERVRSADRFPSRDGEALPDKTFRGVDDPERGSTVARSGGPGRQPTASSAPASPAASAEQLVPSGTAGADSGGSGRGVAAPPVACTDEPEPAGSSRGDPSRFEGAIDMTGFVFGDLTVVERRPNCGGNATWTCRCTCGRTCVEVGTNLRLRARLPRYAHLLACSTCRRQRIAKRRAEAEERRGQKRGPHRCSVCREPGHNAATCPSVERPEADEDEATDAGVSRMGRPLKLAPKKGDCTACFSMPSRVEGPRCVDCGLEAETPVRATDFTSGESPLGRAV